MLVKMGLDSCWNLGTVKVSRVGEAGRELKIKSKRQSLPITPPATKVLHAKTESSLQREVAPNLWKPGDCSEYDVGKPKNYDTSPWTPLIPANHL